MEHHERTNFTNEGMMENDSTQKVFALFTQKIFTFHKN